jgi:hypothetical protein
MCGKGCSDNRHLQRFAESIQANTGEPSKDVKESEQIGTKEPMNPPMPKKEVRVAIVLGGRESRLQGEGPQPVGVLRAIYLNVKTEVHPMDVREKQKRLSPKDEKTYRAEAVCGESCTHGSGRGGRNRAGTSTSPAAYST